MLILFHLNEMHDHNKASHTLQIHTIGISVSLCVERMQWNQKFCFGLRKFHFSYFDELMLHFHGRTNAAYVFMESRYIRPTNLRCCISIKKLIYICVDNEYRVSHKGSGQVHRVYVTQFIEIQRTATAENVLRMQYYCESRDDDSIYCTLTRLHGSNMQWNPDFDIFSN